MIAIYKLKNEPVRMKHNVEFVNVYFKNDNVLVRYVDDDRGFDLFLRLSDLDYVKIQPD